MTPALTVLFLALLAAPLVWMAALWVKARAGW
jgi:hypothetical protein